MTKSVEAVRADELLARLRRHYMKPGPFPGGIFLHECGLNNGGGQRVDAIHVGFTSSSGRLLTGHEIKVSRGDWLRELDKAGKADLWADQCHAWYLVTPRDLIKREELPDGWGWMVPSTRTTTRMDVIVKATVKSYDIGEHSPNWLICRSIMARYDTLRAQEIADARAKANDEARERHDKALADLRAQMDSGHLTPEAARVARILRLVNERTTGMWTEIDDAQIVDALVDVRQVREATRSARYELQTSIMNARRVTETFSEAYGALAKELANLGES